MGKKEQDEMKNANKEHEKLNEKNIGDSLDSRENFIKNNETMIVAFVIPLVAFCFKMIQHIFIIAKLDYWKISRENVSSFGNFLDSFTFWITVIFLFNAVFLLVNTFTRNKEFVECDPKLMCGLYVPLAMFMFMTICLPYMLKIYDVDTIYDYIIFMLLISFVIWLIGFLLCKTKVNKFVCFALFSVLFLFVCWLQSIKIGENIFGIIIFNFVFFLIMYMIALIMAIGTVQIWNILLGFFDSAKAEFILNKWTLVKENDKPLKKAAAFLMVSLPLATTFGIYLLPQLSSENLTEFTIVETKLPYENTTKNYIVLLENNEQYYVAEYRVEEKIVKIFNGEYWIISKEGIKIRNQQFNKSEKTDMSRTEYYA